MVPAEFHVLLVEAEEVGVPVLALALVALAMVKVLAWVVRVVCHLGSGLSLQPDWIS